ncbi:Tellurium resistance [Allostreptomyces psammosilenae]|uniref:Tellurite resistance protein TerA n=1 Tax=Allostreptomyces psammosilenae TaxID=1892865 RepID=A0A852ZZS4_9ACTN|nr:Tellurium resistance [Allostreptomyces psammosilenae]NYI06720.1 tellurite resistance protein TerA [Allostreptomyces psammosilenae]
MSLRDYLSRTAQTTFDGHGRGRVVLTRARPVFSLTDTESDSGRLEVSLTWRAREPEMFTRERGSLLRPFRPQPVQAPGRAMVNIDLDLGCLWELADGSRGVVQPLGGLYGNLEEPPYVLLSGDVKAGGTSGETLSINLDKKDEIRRMLIFVYIYDGTPAFDRAHAKVTIRPTAGQGGLPVEIDLLERAPQARSVAVALLENRGGRLLVRREMRYVYGFQGELDRLYGWGMAWGEGVKPAQ